MLTLDLTSELCSYSALEDLPTTALSPIEAPTMGVRAEGGVMLANPSSLALALIGSATLVCVGLIQSRTKSSVAAVAEKKLIRPRRRAA